MSTTATSKTTVLKKYRHDPYNKTSSVVSLLKPDEAAPVPSGLKSLLAEFPNDSIRTAVLHNQMKGKNPAQWGDKEVRKADIALAVEQGLLTNQPGVTDEGKNPLFRIARDQLAAVAPAGPPSFQLTTATAGAIVAPAPPPPPPPPPLRVTSHNPYQPLMCPGAVGRHNSRVGCFITFHDWDSIRLEQHRREVELRLQPFLQPMEVLSDMTYNPYHSPEQRADALRAAHRYGCHLGQFLGGPNWERNLLCLQVLALHSGTILYKCDFHKETTCRVFLEGPQSYERVLSWNKRLRVTLDGVYVAHDEDSSRRLSSTHMGGGRGRGVAMTSIPIEPMRTFLWGQ